ncbi:MAG: hypothetical protein ACK5HT_18750, partial [Draconibacterium sp.]
ETKPKESEGVYFIRTSLDNEQEQTLWTIYNTLTEVEATFRLYVCKKQHKRPSFVNCFCETKNKDTYATKS